MTQKSTSKIRKRQVAGIRVTHYHYSPFIKAELIGQIGLCLLMCGIFCLALGVSDGYANATAVGNSICKISSGVITTSVGRGLATIGILTVGIMATLGRVTWPQAIVVGVGISVIFGAHALAGMIAGNNAAYCPGLD